MKNDNQTKKRLSYIAWGSLVLWGLNFLIADTKGIVLDIYAIFFFTLPAIAFIASVILVKRWKKNILTLIISIFALIYLAIGSYMAATFD
ncbi:MAG: hypothetical protein AAB360_03780 [Patescibacteria group bacterium]